MKRVIIIGCPGSGKSTFSRKLHETTKLPLYHLDMIYWNPDRTTLPKDIFRRKLTELLQKDCWIIDGNYASTMEQRIQACDTVIFLDYPTEVCIEGALARLGKVRDDIAWSETEQEIDTEFMDFIRNYQQNSRPVVLNLLEQYKGKAIFIFHKRQEAEDFLNNLQT